MYKLGTRSYLLIGSLTKPPTTTVIPNWFKRYILRQRDQDESERMATHRSFDASLTLKGLLPPAYDETTHSQRSLQQLRSKTSPLEKYIVSAVCDTLAGGLKS